MSSLSSARALVTAALMGSAPAFAIAPSVAFAAPDGGYADLVEQVSPSVVFIEVTRAAPAQMQIPPELEEQMRRHFGDRFSDRFPDDLEDREMRGLGTGFFISDDGMIVTNNHVVQGASEITVSLEDGRSFTAEVVGSDPLTDVALLQVVGDETFDALTFGDSDDMRRGDDVMAIGNPFGLGGTVTTGIVSALARDINAGPYDSFIQTDAAINRGNSGGPLFNDAGEVIGMNTAIFSRSGGSNGIGFAVPSNMIERVVADLADDGMIERGWLGVQIGLMSEEIASVLGYDEPVGATVEAVSPESPAEEAGFLAGDIILQFEGIDLEDPQALQRAVADVAPGTDVEVTIFRKGDEMTLDVTLGTLPVSDT